MKILLTSDWFTPAINGVVTSVRNLCRGLEARGHDVRILTLSQDTRSYTKDNVTYIGSVSAGMVYPGARLRTASGGGLIRELTDWEPDVVHSNCEFSTFRMARKIAGQRNIPLIHTYHTVYEDYTHYVLRGKALGKHLAGDFSRRTAAKTDCLIAPTEKLRKLLVGYGIDRPIYVIPTGIEQKAFYESNALSDRSAVRRELGIRDNCTLPVFVGRLAKEKKLRGTHQRHISIPQ